MTSSRYADYVVKDLLSDLDGVEARAMFGGHGLYRNGTIFGIIADDALFFKTDVVNRADYESRGSAPFAYDAKGGEKVVMSYWEVPADIAEDRERIAEWALRSVEVSHRAQKKKKKKRSKENPTC